MTISPSLKNTDASRLFDKDQNQLKPSIAMFITYNTVLTPTRNKSLPIQRAEVNSQHCRLTH